MPGRIISYAGSTIVTGGGMVVAQGEHIGNNAVVQTGVGAIILGVLTFAAPHVTQFLKDWREERRENFGRQIEELRNEVRRVSSRLDRANNMLALAYSAIERHRAWMLEAHTESGKPLPDGFLNVLGASDFESIAGAVPERKVIEMIEGRRSMPTPDPDRPGPGDSTFS